MKIVLYLLATIVLSINSVCMAYDPPYASNPGEVIFFTQGSLSEVEPIQVTCTLNGMVFDNSSVWNDIVSSQHSEFDTYLFPGTSTYNNLLRGSTHELTTTRNLVSWESVYDGDAVADIDECTGMVGWGVYTFNLHLQGSQSGDILFTLNTLDGRWMYENGADDPTNKFIFKVTREQDGTLTLELFNWNLGFFVEVETQSTVFYWSNNVTGSRFRDGLNPSSVEPFSLSLVNEYPLGCDEAVIDVPLRCYASLVIGSERKISIVDFFDNYTQTYQSTIVRFASMEGIYVNFDGNPNHIATLFIQGHDTENPKSVILASMSYDGSIDTRYSLWSGIRARREVDKYSTSSIDLKHCAILNAAYGMEIRRFQPDDQFHNLEIDSCIIRYCGVSGIETWNSNINLHSTEIDYSNYGVWHEGYSFYDNHPNRIEDCRIQDLDRLGIVINNHARGYNLSSGRPLTLTIQGNFMQDCRYHGISVFNSLAIVRWNHISAMGGSKAYETPPAGYSGLWAVQSQLCLHGNLIELCTAYGLHADKNSFVHGNYLNYNLGDGGYGGIDNANELLQGRNCFEANDFNVGASNNSGPPSAWEFTKIVLGQRPYPNDPLGLNYLGHANAFTWPTQTDGWHSPWQMTAEHGSVIHAYRNFWESTDLTEPVNISPPAKIYRELVLPDVEDVCDRWLVPPQNRNVFSSPKTYSNDAEMILTRTLLGLTSEAATMAYNAIDNSMDSTETSMLMLALRSAYIYDYDDVARDTLRKYALSPMDPGVQVDYLTSAALVHLITAEILVDNWEGAIVAIDTVLAREAPPVVKAEYLARKSAYIFRTAADSSQLSTIDSLLTLYPDENTILIEKFLLTRDTTWVIQMAKSISSSDQKSTTPSPNVISFPNPANRRQTVVAPNAPDVRAVLLYDYLGRTVDATLYRYELAPDGIQMAYNLPEGVYYMAILFDYTILHAKVLVHPR